MPKGIITRSTGSWYDIRTAEGQFLKGRLKGKFKIKDLKVTNPIAVGDIVEYNAEAGEEEGSVVIHDIMPRKNYLIRKSVHKSEHGHLIATNLDQTLLVMTLAYPRTSLGFLDRFLISAEAFRIPAIIVFNKTDVLTPEQLEEVEFLMQLYTNLGYTCIKTSAINNEGLDTLKKLLVGKTTLFSGHSGAGKSTLVNVLIPGLNVKTGEISDFVNKGVHSTTFAEMFTMSENSYIIDTPGIKELGLFDIGNEELSHYFPEMRALLGECKFNNCTHTREPKCAIKEGVENGTIAASRFDSYLSIFSGADNRK